MYEVVDELPDGVSMSDHFKDKVAKRPEGKKKYKYARVLHGGRSFYVPLTRDVWRAFDLKGKISTSLEEDGITHRLDWAVGKAMEDVVGAIRLQVRDDILDGIEQSVVQHVNNNFERLMHESLKELERQADLEEPKLLEEPKG